MWAWGLWVWISLSALLLGAMLSFPPQWGVEADSIRTPPFFQRFLRGDMAVRGTLRIALGVSGVGWWCSAAGILTSELFRSLLIISIGSLVLIALFNAGRKGKCSLAEFGVLAGLQGAGWVMIFLVALSLYDGFLR